MFKLTHLLREGEPGQSGEGGAPAGPATTQTQASAVDVQAQIDAALAKQQADFAAQLEQATGHKDLKTFTEAQLKAQGKLQELADANKAEATTYKGKFETLAISNALLSAAGNAVDPATVVDLLQSKAKVDDAGNVTVDGKSAADAVKALLDAKPFLAKAEGGTGSGAPANAGSGVQTKTRAEFEALDHAARAKFTRDGGKIV